VSKSFSSQAVPGIDAAAPDQMEPMEIDVPVTLRAGVEHNIGRIRVRVVHHVYKQKPRLKLVGPSSDRVCPICREVFCSLQAVRSHCGRIHPHVAWPWPNSRPSKPKDVRRTQEQRERQHRRSLATS
jgi:hypothetical protein